MKLSKAQETQVLIETVTRRRGWCSTRGMDKAARRLVRNSNANLGLRVSCRYIMRRRYHHTRRRV